MTLGAIFDVDGVLVDSYDAHLESWRQLGAETGVSISDAEFKSTFGRTSRDIIARFWTVNAGDERAIDALDQRKEAFYREIVKENFPVMKGARDLIQSLHDAGFAIALGSSGPPQNVELAVERLDVGTRIDAIVTGKDVRRGKPDPEVFLIAAGKLGIPERNCVVIEDAPAGILAAHTGGMSALALLSRGRARQDFADHPPDAFANSLREITPPRLRALIEQRHSDKRM